MTRGRDPPTGGRQARPRRGRARPPRTARPLGRGGSRQARPPWGCELTARVASVGRESIRSMHWRGSREPHITIRTRGSHRRGTSRPPVLQPCWWASSMESIPTPAHVRRSPVAGRCVHVSAFPESGQCVRANVQGGPFMGSARPVAGLRELGSGFGVVATDLGRLLWSSVHRSSGAGSAVGGGGVQLPATLRRWWEGAAADHGSGVLRVRPSATSPRCSSAGAVRLGRARAAGGLAALVLLVAGCASEGAATEPTLTQGSAGVASTPPVTSPPPTSPVRQQRPEHPGQGRGARDLPNLHGDQEQVAERSVEAPRILALTATAPGQPATG